MSSVQVSPFVKQLASNNRKVRENALDSLKKYMATKKFMSNSQIQFDQLWKGLYYSMWFSDRPRPQQRLSNELGELYLLYLGNKDVQLSDKAFIRFSKAFWKVICLEWYSIDHHRLDKYLLLMRRVLYNQLKYLREREWDDVLVDKYVINVLGKLPLSGDRKVYNGIPFHIIDIFVDEWEKLVLRNGKEADEVEDNDIDDETEIELISQTPLPKFIALLQSLSSDITNIKVLREKIKEDVLADPRLYKWGVLTEKDNENHEDEVEEEEWKGF
ncbi:Rrp1p Ecym_7219 [Eremothecium cymbalariae DBVPG|uniref:Ribosomal RNA-processing protein 1 n=1 Tax=Eremothecium cymbalariae (strain CBS 270.75 / DBVPG 7215 / KCTC 17166 / NRRL Y-17582) TaxID=931890 RepID=G8JW50_ERECY|nr:hypothetical protein Ecym_7219 [Eremothecium cymbalariae DBVPG\